MEIGTGGIVRTADVCGDLATVGDGGGAAGGLIDEGGVTAVVDVDASFELARGSGLCGGEQSRDEGEILELHFEVSLF
jgi:hypothetical protein